MRKSRLINLFFHRKLALLKNTKEKKIGEYNYVYTLELYLQKSGAWLKIENIQN